MSIDLRRFRHERQSASLIPLRLVLVAEECPSGEPHGRGEAKPSLGSSCLRGLQATTMVWATWLTVQGPFDREPSSAYDLKATIACPGAAPSRLRVESQSKIRSDVGEGLGGRVKYGNS